MPENTVEIGLKARDEASGVINGVVGNLRMLVGQIAATAGLTGIAAGIGGLAKKGMEFNKVMEDSKGGIAGVLLMTREYVNAAGKVVTGQEAINASFVEASAIQEKLKKDALGTAASYTELVGAFQSALAPAAAAGVKNLDDVREITVMATQAMAALNIPTVQAAQELRGLFSGETGPDNRLNQILRITKADLAGVAGNTEKAAKLFKDRLGPAASAAAMQTGTFTVRLSNLGDIVDQVMGKATGGIFKELSETIATATKAIEGMAPAAEAAGTAILTSFKAAFGPIATIVGGTFGAIDARMEASGGTWTEVIQGFAVTFNNIMGVIRSGWEVVMAALLHPLDALRVTFGNLLGNIISMLADVASKIPDFLGGSEMEGWLRGAADAVDEWGTKNNAFLGDVETGLARAEKAWEDNEKAIVGAGRATKATTDLTGKAKDGVVELGEAAYHAGVGWRNGSVEAEKAMAKLNLQLAEFNGDSVGVAVAKIEEDFNDLRGAIGFAMGQGWIAFNDGLARLEALAETKGQKITAAIFNGEAVAEEAEGFFAANRRLLSKQADDILAAYGDAASGVAAGWAMVMAQMPTAAESAARAVQDVWQNMGRAFDGIFASALKGDLDGIGQAFEGWADSLLSTFTSLVSDMVLRWASGMESIGEGWANLNKSMQNANGGLSVQGGLMAAGTGYAIGGMVGQGTQANQIGAAAGAVIGAIVLSAIPVVGTIIGAIVGGLIGELFNKNTEKHLSGRLGSMVGATAYTQRPIYAPEPRGPKGIDDVYDPGEPIGWETVATRETPRTSLERAGQLAFQSQAATLADIFRKGSADQARALLGAYQAALKESLSGANFDIAAGSVEDIEKDAQFLLQSLLPRIGLSAAFGQTGYLPTGYKDRPGGIPGINYGMPGMNPDGTWMEKTLFDPNAPIPKLLAGLGVTAERIGEIAGQISTDDPAKLLAYISSLVDVLVEFKRLGEEMGKTIEEIWAGWDSEKAAGPTSGIKKAAGDVALLFESLDLYSGTEQIAKTKEAQAASAQLWDSVLSYLSQLKQLADSMTATLTATRTKMRDFLSPKGEAEQITGANATIDSGWGKLLGAKTAEEAQAAAAEMGGAVDLIFGIMAERITRGRALLESLAALSKGLGSLATDTDSARLEGRDPLRKWGTDLVKIQNDVAKASALSGAAQISAIEGVRESATTLYQNLKGILMEVAATGEAVRKSLSAQIWEIGVGEMDPKGQATAITERIAQLQAELKAATSPAEIQAITAEIQSLTGRYLGQFEKDDPNRKAAVDWARQQLEATGALAQEALDQIREAALAQAAELEAILKGATTMISTNVEDAATVIKNLSFTLGELDRVFREVIVGLGNAALEALAPLTEAMNGAVTLLTGAAGTTTTALVGENGVEPAARATASALDDLTAAIRGTIGALGAGPTGAPAANSGATPPATAPTAREVVPLMRRYAGALAPRTAS